MFYPPLLKTHKKADIVHKHNYIIIIFINYKSKCRCILLDCFSYTTENKIFNFGIYPRPLSHP